GGGGRRRRARCLGGGVGPAVGHLLAVEVRDALLGQVEGVVEAPRPGVGGPGAGEQPELGMKPRREAADVGVVGRRSPVVALEVGVAGGAVAVRHPSQGLLAAVLLVAGRAGAVTDLGRVVYRPTVAADAGGVGHGADRLVAAGKAGDAPAAV